MMNLHQARPDHSTRHRGFSLIELLVVVAIVAVISAIAYPSYTNFIVKSKRAVGTSTMLRVADRQQQFFMDNKQYALSLTALGFATDPIVLNDEGAETSATDNRRTYSLAITNATATGYTLVATPLLAQASKDACAKLTLTQAGTKGQTGSGENCW